MENETVKLYRKNSYRYESIDIDRIFTLSNKNIPPKKFSEVVNEPILAYNLEQYEREQWMVLYPPFKVIDRVPSTMYTMGWLIIDCSNCVSLLEYVLNNTFDINGVISLNLIMEEISHITDITELTNTTFSIKNIESFYDYKRYPTLSDKTIEITMDNVLGFLKEIYKRAILEKKIVDKMKENKFNMLKLIDKENDINFVLRYTMIEFSNEFEDLSFRNVESKYLEVIYNTLCDTTKDTNLKPSPYYLENDNGWYEFKEKTIDISHDMFDLIFNSVGVLKSEGENNV